MSDNIHELDDSNDSEVSSTTDLVTTRAQQELLAIENRRLREQYNRLQRSRYRRVAIGLLLVGVIAGISGFLYPSVANVALILSATGGFGAVLTYYLTPEQFITGSVGIKVSNAYTDHIESLVTELGLSGEQIYDPRVETAQCRLLLPKEDNSDLPDATALADTFVITRDETTYGVALSPTGARLYQEFVAATNDIPAEPTAQASAVGEGLVESFEIADNVRVDADPADGRVTAEVTGSLFGDNPSIDDPVVSTLAVAVAVAAESPVTVSTEQRDNGYTVSYHWTAESSDNNKRG
jgi:hypothetical protein